MLGPGSTFRYAGDGKLYTTDYAGENPALDAAIAANETVVSSSGIQSPFDLPDETADDLGLQDEGAEIAGPGDLDLPEVTTTTLDVLLFYLTMRLRLLLRTHLRRMVLVMRITRLLRRS